MIRRHSSLHPDEPEADWFSDALTPYYLKRGYNPKPQVDMPPVEPETPEEEAERKKVVTEAIHMTLLQRYEQETT